MAGKLAGKVALITGGSKGIGAASAIRLAAAGASVVINYSSDSQSADEIVAKISSEQCYAVKADASSLEGIKQMVKATVDKFGKIDILIPNAGILPMNDVASTTESDFDKAIAINVKGPYFLVQQALPHMGPGSHVVLVSSTLCHSSTVTGNYLLYNTTKGAIEQMVRVLAKDLGRKEIFVNAVAPGPTDTELFLRGKPEGLLKMIASQSPFNRRGLPDEVAETIFFLSYAPWVSGQVVKPNGAVA